MAQRTHEELCSPHLFYFSTVQDPATGSGTAYSRGGLPTSVKTILIDMPTGQPVLDTTSLRQSSQVILGCVQLPIKVDCHNPSLKDGEVKELTYTEGFAQHHLICGWCSVNVSPKDCWPYFIQVLENLKSPRFRCGVAGLMALKTLKASFLPFSGIRLPDQVSLGLAPSSDWIRVL